MNDEYSAEELLAQVAALESEHDGNKETLEQLSKEIAAVNESLIILRRKRDEITSADTEARNKIRRLKTRAESAQRIEDAEKKRKQLLEAYNEKVEEIERDTAGAPWREFAFEHQITGGQRLAVANRGICADKRGLGKTLTSLVWLDMTKAKKVLVLCPNKTVPQFVEEIQQWQPDRSIFNLANMDKDKRSIMYPLLHLTPEFIVTLNYEAWRRDKSIIDDLVATGIDTIITDEAHKIKSSTKITAKGVFQLVYRPNYCPTCDKVDNFLGPWETRKGVVEDRYHGVCPHCDTPLTSTVKNTLSMTGTPFINRPQELFSLLFIVDKTRFPSERKFLYDYCYSYAPNRWRFVEGGLERLVESMSEFFIQRDRNSIGVHVPPPDIKIYTVEKDYKNYYKQYEAEKKIKDYALMEFEKGGETFQKNFFNILETINRERQVMTWPAGIHIKLKDEDFESPTYGEVLFEFDCDVEESQKLDEAMDLINDLLEEGERVVVFSKFKAPLYEGHRRVSGQYKSAMATGDQPDYIRDGIRRDFDLKYADEKNYKYQIMWATYDSFGDSVNLNAARHMVMIDDEWAPGYQDQAIGRIDRINNQDQASVHIFRVEDSIDDFMAGLLEEKKKLTEGFEVSITAADLLKHLKGE